MQKSIFLLLLIFFANFILGQDYSSYTIKKNQTKCEWCISEQRSVIIKLIHKNIKYDSLGYLFYMDLSGIADSMIIYSKYYYEDKVSTVHIIQLSEYIILIPTAKLPITDKKLFKFLKRVINQHENNYRGRYILGYLKHGYKPSGGPF